LIGGGCTVSDDGRPKSFDGTSAESLEDASTENRIVGGGICTPDVCAKEHAEGDDENRPFSEYECQWDPEKVA
jgi:hypothetical protein